MTKPATTTGLARVDQFFAAVVGFCADFCSGARQGGFPHVPRPH